ncbi:MAG: HlyD family efflux transporter periplasmic adaptor subunit [Kofleriaceae bacterium]
MTPTIHRRGLVVVGLLAATACGAKPSHHDASGVFEARETIIAAETAGQILRMPIEEGQELAAQAVAAEIDCAQLELQKAQLEASEGAIGERTTEAKPQLDVLRQQERATAAQLAVQRAQAAVLERERARFQALVDAQAAPAKQLADIEGQLAVLTQQMASTESQIAIVRQQRTSYGAQVALQNRATTSEREPTQARIATLAQQITKCQVVNPIAGTVLTKYAEQFEFATPGKPLYKIADLRTIVLRAYVTADQLGKLKLAQPVRVFVDDGAAAFREVPGTLAWVSDKAEFTPKTIQTKDERSNLVYAVKIRVPNDGTLKIGMYGEVAF